MSKRNNRFNQFVNELVIKSCRLVRRQVRMVENRYDVLGQHSPRAYSPHGDHPTIDLTLQWHDAVYNLEFVCGPSVSKTIKHPEQLIRMLESEDVEFVIRRRSHGKAQTRQTPESIFSAFR